jgi:hypothetical protein
MLCAVPTKILLHKEARSVQSSAHHICTSHKLLAMSKAYFSAASAVSFRVLKFVLFRFEWVWSNQYMINNSRSSTVDDLLSSTASREPSTTLSEMELASAKVSETLQCTLNWTPSDNCSTRSASGKQTSHCQWLWIFKEIKIIPLWLNNIHMHSSWLRSKLQTVYEWSQSDLVIASVCSCDCLFHACFF